MILIGQNIYVFYSINDVVVDNLGSGFNGMCRPCLEKLTSLDYVYGAFLWVCTPHKSRDHCMSTKTNELFRGNLVFRLWLLQFRMAGRYRVQQMPSSGQQRLGQQDRRRPIKACLQCYRRKQKVGSAQRQQSWQAMLTFLFATSATAENHATCVVCGIYQVNACTREIPCEHMNYGLVQE